MKKNFVRITKWISPNESIMTLKLGLVSGTAWCHNESEDMEERTGNKCQVHINKDGKLAVYRDI